MNGLVPVLFSCLELVYLPDTSEVSAARHTILPRVIQKLIIPADQRRPKPLQMQGLSLDLWLRRVSAAVESTARGIGSHEQAKRQALDEFRTHLRQEGNEREHDAVYKDRKDCGQSCSGSACAREFAEHDCEHAGTGCREALSEDAVTFAVFNGPQCGN